MNASPSEARVMSKFSHQPLLRCFTRASLSIREIALTNREHTMNKLLLKQLKQHVHHLEPVVLLGAKGLTNAVHAEIECALQAHELIKIKLSSKDKAEKDLLTKTICEAHHATLITQIGHIIAIYRQRIEE